MTPQEIISDDEIARVHGNANFGAMDPREVVNDGVRKTAVGYHCGSTQLHILRDHGLVTKPRSGSSDVDLTKKGKAYARSIYRDTTPARAEAQDEGAAALRESVAKRVFVTVPNIKGAWDTAYQIADAVMPLFLYAHPSPPPAADEDRVRIAVEALEPFAAVMADIGESEDDADCFRNPNRDYAKSQGISVGHVRRAAEAFAALKSTAAKEGEKK